MAEILVVDDDHLVRNSLKDTLHSLDHHVVLASSGVSGLRTLRESRPDIIMVDFQMPPGINGIEFARIAKENFPDIPIILMTGNFGDPRLQGLTFIDRILYKPMKREEIRDTLSDLLSPRP